MNTNELLSAIDAEISRLTKVRVLLDGVGDSSSNPRPTGSANRIASTGGTSTQPRRRGRPKGSKNEATSLNLNEFARKRRTLSPEAKERIAAAQRARWAKQKGTATAKKSGPAAGRRAKVKPTGKTKAAPAKKLAAKTLTKPAALKQRMPARKVAANTTPTKKAATKETPRTAVKKAARARKRSAKQALAESTPPLSPPEVNTNA